MVVREIPWTFAILDATNEDDYTMIVYPAYQYSLVSRARKSHACDRCDHDRSDRIIEILERAKVDDRVVDRVLEAAQAIQVDDEYVTGAGGSWSGIHICMSCAPLEEHIFIGPASSEPIKTIVDACHARERAAVDRMSAAQRVDGR